ncbi:CLUMA_CG016086, isoform A [Clunio marinus]|uniref:CLUMA_CG016086, isoform A n=1 Tax=Clunio marinus TaxID=568069 RepID=A0A1J1IRP4_9DIPT|nr:CLUMA_CG016086, isoform A [Clunio marinus]
MKVYFDKYLGKDEKSFAHVTMKAHTKVSEKKFLRKRWEMMKTFTNTNTYKVLLGSSVEENLSTLEFELHILQ